MSENFAEMLANEEWKEIHTGEVVYGPIFGKESHCAENGQYPFSISEEFLDKNPDYPELNTCGIYLLDLNQTLQYHTRIFLTNLL